MAYINPGLSVLFITAYIIQEFTPSLFPGTIMAITAITLFCLNFQQLKPLNRTMIIILLTVSGFLIWSIPGSFDWSRAVVENAGIITLLLTAPMLGSILSYAPYEKVILSLADRYIRTNYIFYVMILCLVGFLSMLMNLAAVPFVNQLVVPLMTRFPPAILHQALFRGYIINLFWAPNMICVAVVLQYMNISWQELAPTGIAFSVLAFITACIVGKYEISVDESCQCRLDSVEQVSFIYDREDNRKHIFLLLIQVILVFAVLILLPRYAGTNIYRSLAIAAMFMPFLFALILKKIAVYRQSVGYYVKNTLPSMCNEFLLFTSIGFFGFALAQSPAIDIIQAQLAGISDYSSGIFALLIISLIAGLSVIGIHPIISISSFSIAFADWNMGLSSLQLSITLLTGYIMYFLLSPFASMILLMSGLTRQSVYAVGLRMNSRYALIVALMVSCVVYLWRYL